MRATIITWACAWAAGVAATNPGVLGVHAVFPRNDTYSPTDMFPVVFAFSNPELLPFVPLSIDLEVLNRDNTTDLASYVKSTRNPIRAENVSTNGEPYFDYLGLHTFNREGRWRIYWNLRFGSCEENAKTSPGPFDNNPPALLNTTTGFIDFTTKNSAPGFDLVAATTNEKNCPSDALALNVTKIRDRTEWESTSKSWTGDSEQCGVLGSSDFTTESCKIKINETIATEVSTYLTWARNMRECLEEKTQAACDEDLTSAAYAVVARGWTFWIATVVSLGYVLVLLE